MKKKPPSLSTEDLDLWEIFTKNIHPLKKKFSSTVLFAEENHTQTPLSPLKKPLPSKKPPLFPPPQISPLPEKASSPKSPPLLIPKKASTPITDLFWKKYLKKKPRHALDLHGYTKEEAYEKIHTFLQQVQNKQGRYCQIIVGKGRSSPNQEGILRRFVPHILENHPLVYQFEFTHRNLGSIDIILRKKVT